MLLSVRYLTLCLGLACLAGCASQVKMLSPIGLDAEFGPGEDGLVVARVINASSYPFDFNQLTLTPDNVFESDEVKFQRLQPAMVQLDDTTVFASKVPPGRYSLDSIRAFHVVGDFYYSNVASAEVGFGTFIVEPGRVTDLGTLIYYQKYDGESLSQTLLRAPDSEPGEVLDKYFPNVAVAPDELLGWLPDDAEEDRFALYAAVASSPNVFHERYLAPDGSLYFLGKLGVFLKRSAEGDWELDAVDTNHPLEAIAQNGRGDLAVGGMEGRLFFKPDGSDWQDISLPPQQHVEYLVFREDNVLEALVRSGPRLTVMRCSPNAAQTTWQELNAFTAKVGWKTLPVEYEIYKKNKRPRNVTDASLFEWPGSHFVSLSTAPESMYQLNPPERTEVFGFVPDDWSVYQPDPEPSIKKVVSAGSIELGERAGAFWGSAGGPHYMVHNTASGEWEELGMKARGCAEELNGGEACTGDGALKLDELRGFEFVGVPWFSSPQQGLALVSFDTGNLWTGRQPSRILFVATEDGGQSWRHTNLKVPEAECNALAPELADRLIVYCNGFAGDFYESTDRGRSWVHVRQHQSF